MFREYKNDILFTEKCLFINIINIYIYIYIYIFDQSVDSSYFALWELIGTAQFKRRYWRTRVLKLLLELSCERCMSLVATLLDQQSAHLNKVIYLSIYLSIYLYIYIYIFIYIYIYIYIINILYIYIYISTTRKSRETYRKK